MPIWYMHWECPSKSYMHWGTQRTQRLVTRTKLVRTWPMIFLFQQAYLMTIPSIRLQISFSSHTNIYDASCWCEFEASLTLPWIVRVLCFAYVSLFVEVTSALHMALHKLLGYLILCGRSVDLVSHWLFCSIHWTINALLATLSM